MFSMLSSTVLVLFGVFLYAVFLQGVGGILFDDSYYRAKAFNLSCSKHNCSNKKCTVDAGWNIYGADVGCCGNYDGCCHLATRMCYLHDVMCHCCMFGWLICGPDCKPEPHCHNRHTKENTKEMKMTTPFSVETEGIQPNETQDLRTSRDQISYVTSIPKNSNSNQNTLHENLEGASQVNETAISQFINYTSDDNSTSANSVINRIKPMKYSENYGTTGDSQGLASFSLVDSQMSSNFRNSQTQTASSPGDSHTQTASQFNESQVKTTPSTGDVQAQTAPKSENWSPWIFIESKKKNSDIDNEGSGDVDN